jgi:uncharacterized membrane protein YfcA
MMILAWIGAVFIGISLGLLGSGGSILTVPVLIYLVGQDPKVAFASSLAIVGLISVVSAIGYARKGGVDWRSVLWFGFPGMLGAYIFAHFAEYMASWVQLLIFAALLLVAATLMLRPLKLESDVRAPRAFWKIAVDGLLVGGVTGLVGVGGGFLIIPALVLLGGLSMTLAVGTSLVIITMKSASGFVEYYHVLETLSLSLDWQIILIFALLGIIGGQIGTKLNHILPQELVRKLFAFFLIIMGTFILWQNLPKLTGAFS